MKRIASILVVVTALLALSSNALAQGRGGQGPAGPPPGEGQGPKGGPMGGPMGGGRMLVAPDGTALVVSTTPAATADAAPTHELLAVNAAGNVAWRYALASGTGDMVIAGSNVVLSVGGLGPDATVTPALVAVGLATGTEAWKTTLDGHAGNLSASGSRVLAIVRVPPASAGATPADPKLIAVDASGAIVWSVSL